MRVYLPLVAGVMHPIHMPFVVLPYSWVAPIYVVNAVVAVLVCVGIYVVLLPHILAWRYPMFVSDNISSVLCHNKSF